MTPLSVTPSVLRDYSFLADGERGALIDQRGTLVWLCVPGWADEAVFAGLLGGGGVYQVCPDGTFVSGGHYEDGTLIWRSRWVTEAGIVEVREALAYPGDPDRVVVLRRVVAVDGPARLKVLLQPAGDYGRRPLHRWSCTDGVWIAAGAGNLSARWTGAPDARAERVDGGHEALCLDLVLDPGAQRDLVLELARGPLDDASRPDADESWRRTELAWRRAVPGCTRTVAPRDCRLAVAVLRGMTGRSGGTVAAATTSLPERVESSRNYDYRFCWVRDVAYVGQAGAALEGGDAILDDAVRWISQRLAEDGAQLEPAYRGDGQPVPEPTSLDLPGYPGGDAVAGNRIRTQFQLDVFGEALLLFSRAASRDRLDADGWRAAKTAIDAIESRWSEADAGVWETHPSHWTHSRLISVAALRAICSVGAPKSWAARALPLADRILSEIGRTSLHPSGRWQRSPDDKRLDSSLLLAEVRGAVPSEDPRSRRTRRSIVDELSQEGLLYRYRVSDRPLGESEGAFLVCNFWMVLACLGAGETDAAVHWFERARAACGSPGLFSEEYDVGQRQLRGNLPQAFVHALLLESAADGRWR